MFQHLPPLKSLPAFEAAARLGGFNQAAEELSVSPGAISYQVKQLESALGTAMFHRRTRQIELTLAGRQFHRVVQKLFYELDAEVARVSRRGRETPLTVSVSTYFVTRWLSPRMGRFLSEYPDTTVRLQHAVNDPDFVLDNVDLAIRWGNGDWPGCESELLFKLPMIAVCAPTFAENNPGLHHLIDLQHCTLLHDQPGMNRWSEWLDNAGVEPWENLTGPVIVDPNVRVQSAIDAQGIVLANPLVQQELDDGKLVEPFDVRLGGYGYYLIYRRRGNHTKSFQRFANWLRDEATTHKPG